MKVLQKRIKAILVLVCLLFMGAAPVQASDGIIAESVHFFAVSDDSEIQQSIDGSVYARAKIFGEAGKEVWLFLAAYSNGSLIDICSQHVTMLGGAQNIIMQPVSAAANGMLRFFIWDGNCSPYTATIEPGSVSDVPLKEFSVTATKNNVKFIYTGDINHTARTIILDIPAECTNGAQNGFLTEEELSSLVPVITCADGWSTADSGARDFSQLQTYTFTAEGREPVTYTVRTERSDLGRSSDFENVTLITPTENASYFMSNSSRGRRQYMPFGGHFGNGSWWQNGYRADAAGLVDEENTFGTFSLVSGIHGNTGKAMRIAKTKSGGVMEMFNIQPYVNNRAAAKYRLELKICMDDVRGNAYIMASNTGGLVLETDGAGYDLYYRGTDGSKVLLAKHILEEDTWHNLAVVGRCSAQDGKNLEKIEVYIDGSLAAKYEREVKNFASVGESNFTIGLEAAATGTLYFDDWRATVIEQSLESNSVVWIVGDSLACHYAADSITQGWSTYIGEYLDLGRAVPYSIAVSGSVSGDYLDADGAYHTRWNLVEEQMKKGDVLLIALGYNEGRTEAEQKVYADNLRKFARAALEKNAEPVFITIPVQCTGDGSAYVTRKPECLATMREIAQELDVPILDLNAKLNEYYAGLTMEEIRSFYEGLDGIESSHPNGDWLHFRESGARMNAQFICELAKESAASCFKELLQGGYVGTLQTFSLAGYEGDVLGDRIRVRIPGRIGGATASEDPDIAAMDFSYTAADGKLERTGATAFLFTGDNGNTKTYTLEAELYTPLIDMDFEGGTASADGFVPNYPATNDIGQKRGGAAATWVTAGSSGAGEARIENGAYRIEKNRTGASFGVRIQNIEYPAETEQIAVRFDLNTAALLSESSDIMRIKIGENLPYLQMTNSAGTLWEEGKYTFTCRDGLSDANQTWEDAPVLETGKSYTFDIVYTKKPDGSVLMRMTVDGKEYTRTQQHGVTEQMILFPQFSIIGSSAGLFTAYLDNVEVNYTENRLKGQNKVFLVGDSICYTYPAYRISNGKSIQGWGKILQERIDSEQYRVINCAREGQSSSIFLYGGMQGTRYDHRYDLAQSWDFIDRRLQTGDYVMIGLGWNEYNYTDIAGYQEHLRYMAAAAREKGAEPIFITATVGCNMNTFELQNSKLDFVNAMKKVAAEEDVLCLDLNSAEWQALEGKSAAEREAFYTDGTHYTPTGAQMVGELILELLQASDCPLKLAVTEEPAEATDTNPSLVTFNDYQEGTDVTQLNDSRFSTAVTNGSISIERDPAVDGAHGMAVKITTAKGTADQMSFRMPSGSGKSLITAEYDLYIAEDTTRGYSNYNYLFYVAVNNIVNTSFGFNTNTPSAEEIAEGILAYDKASWYIRANTSVTPPSATPAHNRLERNKWYHFKVIYDVKNSTLDYYLDNELVLENDSNWLNSDTMSTAPVSTSGITVKTLNSGVGVFYLDNVQLTAE